MSEEELKKWEDNRHFYKESIKLCEKKIKYYIDELKIMQKRLRETEFFIGEHTNLEEKN